MQQSTPQRPSAAQVTSPSSNVDLLGDLDIISPQPSMPLSVPVQPDSYAFPSPTAQSSVFTMTMTASSGSVVPEAAMSFAPIQPNALTTSAFIPGVATLATPVESVRTFLCIVCVLYQSVNLYLNQAKAHTHRHTHTHAQNTIYNKRRNHETVEKNSTSKWYTIQYNL